MTEPTRSYVDLDDDTARLYRVLAWHPGTDFTAGPLAAALDRPIGQVEHGLTALRNAHLVTPVAPSRYRFHDMTQEHALGLAERHDEPAARRAAVRSMIEWYLRQTAAADKAINPQPPRYSPVYADVDTALFGTAADAHAWFSVERLNVLLAQERADAEGWDELVIQLAEVVWNPLRPSYFVHDLIATQHAGIAAARRCAHVLEAVFLARLGFAESSCGEHDAAVTACTTALYRATAFEDTWAMSVALSTRARALTAAGRPVDALEDLHSALGLDEQRGDELGIALRHRRIGEAHAHPDVADHPQAISHLQTAANLMASLGDDTAHARVITYLAEVHINNQQPDIALRILHGIEDALAASGSPRYQGHARTVMGTAHAQLGDAANAEHCYTAALRGCLRSS